MKKILSKLFVAVLMLFATLSITTSLSTSQTYATNQGPQTQQSGNCTQFLGMNSWNCGLLDWNIEGNIKENIQKIILNVGDAGVTIVGYVALGFIIYGGYLYMISSGDAGKIASGKKTITRAIIGLLIVACAKMIFGAILSAMGTRAQVGAGQETAVIMHAINWVIGVAGIVCVIYIVVGGVGYMTSAGDVGKLQRAKNTILYAIIGLIIVALSFAITNFVISRLANGQQSYLNGTNSLAINKSKKG